MRLARAAAAVGAIVAAIALIAPALASAGTSVVNIQFAAFAPGALDVLPGETVRWENVSERTHTVDADDGSFTSGDLLGAATFARTFDTVGSYAYHCTIHPSMTGQIDVRRVTLGPLPAAAVPLGEKVEFSGRTADPGEPVRIERVDGTTSAAVATAVPASDGAWTTTVSAVQTGDYRAATGSGVSQSRRLLVSDRRILVRATRRGVAVTVKPALPYGRIVLEQDLRERFGWWPQSTGRLDYLSEASFRVARRPSRVRVSLLDRDGFTPLVTSRVLTLPAGR